MYIDIIVFAVIAAFLIYRLNAVLGTRPHDDIEPRPNPFAATEMPQRNPGVPPPPFLQKPPRKLGGLGPFIDAAANKDGQLEESLKEIAAADATFDIADFMAGAKFAFETIVTAYAKGDRATLQPLLSEKLFADFDQGIKARESANQPPEAPPEIIPGRIKEARITKAQLGGVMAYITVRFDVEQSTTEDIWTFTRDIRSSDPNWTLIETSATDK